MIARMLMALALVAFALTAKAEESVHLVKKGQHLTWIAKKNNVGREAMILANEAQLAAAYDKYCGKLSQEFRTRAKNEGKNKGGLYYCNDTYRRSYANTLRPGMRLIIPQDTAPASVEDVVSKIRGERIAVVIDETGSTDNKRRMIGQYYLAALRQKARSITGIYLFSGPGRVRKIDAVGVTDLANAMHNRGGTENTHEALRSAALDKPDAIILVTDEQGDDWDWSIVRSLPSVYAHCLPDPKYPSCEANLRRLADQTGGSYSHGLPIPSARR